MERRLRLAEDWAIGVLALAALGIALYGTLTRYMLPHFAADWSEEAFVYAVIWAIWLSGGRLVVTGGHVRSDWLLRVLGGRAARALEALHATLGFAFCIAFCFFGFDVVRLALQLNERSDSTLHFPMALYYLAMPVGLLLMAARYATHLRGVLRGQTLPTAPLAPGAPVEPIAPPDPPAPPGAESR
ncbi:MAG: TRAP transporter small permease [Deltaproteobacteria bacterium]|nr:TRAP transporter small permease [Deltaproteobacteria bacterium]